MRLQTKLMNLDILTIIFYHASDIKNKGFDIEDELIMQNKDYLIKSYKRIFFKKNYTEKLSKLRRNFISMFLLLEMFIMNKLYFVDILLMIKINLIILLLFELVAGNLSYILKGRCMLHTCNVEIINSPKRTDCVAIFKRNNRIYIDLYRNLSFNHIYDVEVYLANRTNIYIYLYDYIRKRKLSIMNEEIYEIPIYRVYNERRREIWKIKQEKNYKK